jgi:ferric-dicitrate binding protein FerR (iron transport regulator)
MGRRRRDDDQVPEQTEAETGNGRRRGRGRKLALLIALAGTAAYVMRRNQRKAELDEGIWHEAPTPTA